MEDFLARTPDWNCYASPGCNRIIPPVLPVKETSTECDWSKYRPTSSVAEIHAVMDRLAEAEKNPMYKLVQALEKKLVGFYLILPEKKRSFLEPVLKKYLDVIDAECYGSMMRYRWETDAEDIVLLGVNTAQAFRYVPFQRSSETDDRYNKLRGFPF